VEWTLPLAPPASAAWSQFQSDKAIACESGTTPSRGSMLNGSCVDNGGLNEQDLFVGQEMRSASSRGSERRNRVVGYAPGSCLAGAVLLETINVL
jgi:hypothetical protein